MATLTQDIHNVSLRSVLTAPFRAIFNGLLAVANAQRISKEAEMLLSMTDEELAQRGLKREDLPAYLMREYAYV